MPLRTTCAAQSRKKKGTSILSGADACEIDEMTACRVAVWVRGHLGMSRADCDDVRGLQEPRPDCADMGGRWCGDAGMTVGTGVGEYALLSAVGARIKARVYGVVSSSFAQSMGSPRYCARKCSTISLRIWVLA